MEEICSLFSSEWVVFKHARQKVLVQVLQKKNATSVSSEPSFDLSILQLEQKHIDLMELFCFCWIKIKKNEGSSKAKRISDWSNK